MDADETPGTQGPTKDECRNLPRRNRFLRVSAWIAGGLGAFIVAALVVCLDGVDYRPYFREPYFAQTTARLNAAAGTNHIVRGELAAGFGRALLTPTLNVPQDDPGLGRFKELPLAGYGNRKGRPATGVHDDLYVKA